MATDIRLDPNTHDIDISTQRLETFTLNTEVMRQRIKMALLLRAGEWFADISKGVPYLQFSRQKQNKAFADSTLRATIERVDGVQSVTSFTSTLEGSRTLVVSFSVKTTSGEILDLNLEV